MRRALVLLLALSAGSLAAGGLSAGCRDGGGEGERSLERLERLAFIPPGDCVLPRAWLAGVDCSTRRPLLVDRFEVTRGEWLEWIARNEDALGVPASAFEARWEEGSESWPASWMTQAEAQAFAEDEGLRLLSAREWMRVAAGTRAQRLPWGAPARSVSNSLELGLQRPAPVGTFENGRTTLGVHDLVGNVAEWVDGTLLESVAAAGDARTWAVGGSYLTWTRDLYAPDFGDPEGSTYNAELLDPAHRAEDVGLRVGGLAADYLRSRSPHWGDEPAVRERLRAVGRAWGSAAVPLLEELAREPGAAPGLSALLAGARP